MKILSIFSTITPMVLGTAALGLTLMANSSAQAFPFPDYKPQPRGIPSVRVSGGTRSPLEAGCINDPAAPQLTSIFPDDDLGYTTDRYPAFQWYMPGNQASHVEFNLYEVISDDEGIFQPVYQTAFIPSPAAGIATLQLPQTLGVTPLQPDTYYYWSVEVYCPNDTVATMMAEGFVELLIPDPLLESALANSNEIGRAAIAAENSLWFDATRALTEYRQTQPDNYEAVTSWQTLLESIGLENIADAPLLP